VYQPGADADKGVKAELQITYFYRLADFADSRSEQQHFSKKLDRDVLMRRHRLPVGQLGVQQGSAGAPAELEEEQEQGMLREVCWAAGGAVGACQRPAARGRGRTCRAAGRCLPRHVGGWPGRLRAPGWRPSAPGGGARRHAAAGAGGAGGAGGAVPQRAAPLADASRPPRRR
jgi:hypothetical protein